MTFENGPNEYTDEWKKDMEVWEFSLREDQNKMTYVRNSTATVELLICCKNLKFK